MPPPMPPKGLDEPKNSAKMSSALRGLNRNIVGPSPPVEKNVAPPGPAPPAPGGGTWPLSPSSPYWSYTARFCGSLSTSYASEICLNLFSASFLLLGFLSGCHFMASLR
uniref:DnaJ subfamily B member 5 n=1 Tax=Arundo donax TaxID=35708 RepID=A0A0A9CPK0_ARUDO